MEEIKAPAEEIEKADEPEKDNMSEIAEEPAEKKEQFFTKEKFRKFLNRYGHLLWIGGLVFLFLTVCSTCSFIYPMNEWVDSNV